MHWKKYSKFKQKEQYKGIMKYSLLWNILSKVLRIYIYKNTLLSQVIDIISDINLSL